MKIKELKKGVSLIVLVITIIVMVILAGVIILTLDNSGIINKAQNAVDQSNLAEVKNIAQLAWAEAFLDGKTTKEELEQAVMEKLAEQNITAEYYNGYTMEVTTSGVSFVEDNGENSDDNNGTNTNTTLNHSGIIPEGATYTTGYGETTWDEEKGYVTDLTNLVTYTAGERMPDTPKPLDTYRYGDYTYIYNADYNEAPYSCSLDRFGWQYIDANYDGWLVTIRQETPDELGNYQLKKETYGTILENINGKDVKRMAYTFYNCNTIVTAPIIPKTVTDVERAFDACTSLTGSLTINSTPTYYGACLSGTQITEILGDCDETVKTEILKTK